ncbi:MAG: glycosyltransferase [Acidimicrobiia bacterium]
MREPMSVRSMSSRRPTRVGMVSTYPPTRCGIGNFTASLVDSLTDVAPGVEVDVVRLVEHRASVASLGTDSIEIDPNSPVSLRAAARFLNRRDLAILQHEYGIYGRDDGMAVLDLLRLIDVPKLAVLHTVLRSPGRRQRQIVEGINRQARLVVISETARQILEGTYGIPAGEVTMIPHGGHWKPQALNDSPRSRLITWGLLGPGKGLERSIESIGHLRDLGFDAQYRILGRTHPEVVRREGHAYRRRLESLVARLGLGQQIEFIDRYLDDWELGRMVASSDVVVVPYDNTEQVSSGVITEALGIGRPVVATRFPYAIEMLSDGAGIVVRHDSLAMAQAIAALLGDDERYLRAARAAARMSGSLSWGAVAERYAGLMQGIAPQLATA